MPSCVHTCVNYDYDTGLVRTYDNRNAVSTLLNEHLFFSVRVKVYEVVQNVFLREGAVRIVALIISNNQVVPRRTRRLHRAGSHALCF